MNKEDWENLCDDCGKCCSGTRPKDLGVGIACPGLDCKTNRCTVYDKRLTTHTCLKVEPDNVEELHEAGILPDSCAYVRHVQGKEPLDSPVPAATLIPFALAPRVYQRQHRRTTKRWQRCLTECDGDQAKALKMMGSLAL